MTRPGKSHIDAPRNPLRSLALHGGPQKCRLKLRFWTALMGRVWAGTLKPVLAAVLITGSESIVQFFPGQANCFNWRILQKGNVQDRNTTLTACIKKQALFWTFFSNNLQLRVGENLSLSKIFLCFWQNFLSFCKISWVFLRIPWIYQKMKGYLQNTLNLSLVK